MSGSVWNPVWCDAEHSRSELGEFFQFFLLFREVLFKICVVSTGQGQRPSLRIES